MDEVTDYDAMNMRKILSAAGLKQHISGATHKKGHTLDLLISRICEDLVVNPSIIHDLYRCQMRPQRLTTYNP